MPEVLSATEHKVAEGRGHVRFTSVAGGTGETVISFVWHGEGLEAVGDIARRAGGLAISRLEVSAPESTASGLTHRLLRRVPLGEILAAARATQGQYTHLPAAGNAPGFMPPRGRVQVTDGLLREVALAYLAETAPGKDRAVIQRLSEQFDRPKGTVRTWLGRAREEGWLGPGVRGRVGAEPGPRLREAASRTPTVERSVPWST